MDIFSLVGKLTIDGAANAEKQMGSLQAKVQGAAKGLRIAGAAMTAVGGIITGVATKAIVDYAKMGDEVHKMSLRTGFATETLSRLKYAAAIGGASLATVEKAAKRMAATIYDAEEGLSTAVDAFDNLGVSVEDFRGLNPEEQFMKLAEAIAAIEDPSERSALAQRTFGRAGTEMLPMLEKGTEGLKEMMAEADKFAPIFGKEAAEAAAKLTDTMGQLRGTMDKVKLAIAEKLVPAITPMLEKLRDVISTVSKWVEKNPGLAKTITIVTVAVGAILVPLGAFLFLLPNLVGGLHLLGLAMHAALGPIGLITLGIAALVAGGIVLWKNWDKVTIFITKAWADVKIAVLTDIEKILEGLAKFTSWIPKIGDKVDEARESISRMINAEVVKKAMIEVREVVDKGFTMMGDVAVETEEKIERAFWNVGEAAALMGDAISSSWDLSTDEMLQDTRDLTSEVKEAARDRTRAEIDAIKDQMDRHRDAHRERMKALRDEYDETVKTIDAELRYALKGYEDQIDVIDKQIDDMEDAERDHRDAERKAELKTQIAEEQDADKRKSLEQKLADFLREIQKRQIREEMEEAKDALRRKMDMAREEARNAKEQAQEEYDHKRNLKEKEYNALVEQLENEREALDEALQNKLERYDEDLEAFEELLAQEEEDTIAFVMAYNELMDQLKDKTVTVTTIHKDVYIGGGGGGDEGDEDGYDPGFDPISPGQGYAQGGVISEPTLLYGLRSRRPYAIAGERGKEFITPNLPSIEINIAEMNVRDDRDIDLIAERLVARIRLRTGVRI